MNYNHPLNEYIKFALSVPSPVSSSRVPKRVETRPWPLIVFAWKIHMSDQEEPGYKQSCRPRSGQKVPFDSSGHLWGRRTHGTETCQNEASAFHGSWKISIGYWETIKPELCTILHFHFVCPVIMLNPACKGKAHHFYSLHLWPGARMLVCCFENGNSFSFCGPRDDFSGSSGVRLGLLVSFCLLGFHLWVLPHYSLNSFRVALPCSLPSP